MSIFYLDNEKNANRDFQDKFDLAKFIDGKSDTPEETKERIRKVVQEQ